jgi:hypothetical protein
LADGTVRPTGFAYFVIKEVAIIAKSANRITSTIQTGACAKLTRARFRLKIVPIAATSAGIFIDAGIAPSQARYTIVLRKEKSFRAFIALRFVHAILTISAASCA